MQNPHVYTYEGNTIEKPTIKPCRKVKALDVLENFCNIVKRVKFYYKT